MDNSYAQSKKNPLGINEAYSNIPSGNLDLKF